MGNIALRLPPTLVAYSRPQAQIVVVEIYNMDQIEPHLLQSNRSIAYNSFDASRFFTGEISCAFSRDKIEIRTFCSRKKETCICWNRLPNSTLSNSLMQVISDVHYDHLEQDGFKIVQ